LGAALPPWLGAVLHQARIFNSCDIVLIADAAALKGAALPAELRITQVAFEDVGLSEKHRAFRRSSPLDREFRGGFWTFTSERFFVIETALRKLALTHVVHVENDVMLYCDCAALLPRLAHLYSTVAATFDNDMRCVPGLLYIPGADSIAVVTDFFLAAFDALARARSSVQVNDMMVLGALRGQQPRAIDHLPIIPPDYPADLRSAVGHRVADPSCYSRHYETLKMIFDAAALGQYLGGIDPRNAGGSTVGFVNESCVFDPRLLEPRIVRDSDGRRIPVVETASGRHIVANLHIHSKNPAPFLSA
jgi:hypothetical protein